MLNVNKRTGLITYSKAATIADWIGLQTILNTAGWTLDANGASVTSATSSICGITMGGLPNMRITADLKFIAPTAAGGEDIGVMLHFGSNVVAGSRYYLMARMQAGVFRITKVSAGTGTSVASTSVTLAQDTWATFMLERIGTSVRATLDGANEISGTVSTADVPAAGIFGFRSGFSTAGTISCRSFTVEAWR